MTAAARSFLTAGVIAASVGAITAAPLTGAAAMTTSSAAVRLTATDGFVFPAPQLLVPGLTAFYGTDPLLETVPLGNAVSDLIIAAYDVVEPWVAYGFELADYVLSFIPGLWWIAPAIDLAYFSIEPLVQAGVYSFAELLSGDFAAIGPTIQAGITEAIDNFVFFGLAWIGSLIPLPPLPPFPPFPPFAAAAEAPAAPAAGRGAVLPAAAATPAETQAGTAPEVTVTEPAAEIAAPVSPRPAKASAARSASRTAPTAPAPAASAQDQAGETAGAGTQVGDTQPADTQAAGADSAGPATARGGAQRGSAKAERPAR